MSTIATFGVTVDDIRAAVHNLSITPSSSPTISQVEDYIQYAAAEVSSESEAAGISASGLTSTDSAYVLLKKAVINKVAADILVARNRGEAEAGQYYLDAYLRAIDTLRRFPQRIEEDSENGPDLAYFIEQQTSAELADIQWYDSIAGKIYQGGM